MLGDFLVVASSVVTLFFMMGVGFFFGKRGMLYSDTLSQLSRLLLTVVCPCTVINALQVERSTQLLAGMGQALLLVAASYVVFGGAAHFLFPRQSAPTRAALRFGTVYGNVGFMGLPLVMSVLGEGAVPYCAMGIAVFNVANWTHGVTVMGQKGSLRRAVLNPGVIGFAIAMALFVGGVALPGPVRSAVEYISGLNTPLAMVVIGTQLAEADLPSTFRQPRNYLVSFLRLALFPTLTALLLLPLRSSSGLYCALVLLSATPVAGTTSLFAQQFGRDTAPAAESITLSTLLSILTLPLFAVLARGISMF